MTSESDEEFLDRIERDVESTGDNWIRLLALARRGAAEPPMGGGCYACEPLGELNEAQAARIAQLEADLAHADAKGQENDKLLWGTIERVKKLEAALREIAIAKAVTNSAANIHTIWAFVETARAALEDKCPRGNEREGGEGDDGGSSQGHIFPRGSMAKDAC